MSMIITIIIHYFSCFFPAGQYCAYASQRGLFSFFEYKFQYRLKALWRPSNEALKKGYAYPVMRLPISVF
jgi:hypothetical protein